MIKKVFAATFAVLFTTNVQADTVGLYLGGQIWQNEYRGEFGQENTPIDFNFNKKQHIESE